MRIDSVRNVSFGAQTKKGNDYQKTHAGLACAVITSGLTGGSQIIAEMYKGNLAGKAVFKPLKIAAAAVAISAFIGAGIDSVLNKKNSKLADANPMPMQKKFVRDFNSDKFGIYYDALRDAVIVENKRDYSLFKHFPYEQRDEKDNQYMLKDDGSVRVIAGRDNDTDAFIEDNDIIKNIVNQVRFAHVASIKNS